jgi:hypothetical protein
VAFWPPPDAADTSGMTRFELDELQAVPEWQAVLAAYRDRGLAARTGSAEFDGWLPRLAALEDVDPARLSIIHGRLLALGFLKCQVGGRTVGLQYQLAPEGRQALETSAAGGDLMVPLDHADCDEREPQAA